MATWQQGINSGAFLSGIGTMNENAPKASDANTALAFIRENNEMNRSGANNIGLQALQGLTGTLQGLKQYNQQQEDAAFQKDYAGAMQSGDRQQVRSLMTKYPGYMDKIQSGMKWADDDQRSTVGNLAAGARLAASSPEAMGTWLQNNASDLQRVGLNPAEVAQTYQQNPHGFGEFADHLGMAAIGPDKYFDVQDKIVGQRQNQQKIDETARSNRASEAVQWANNNIAQQNVNLRRMELDDKKYDRQIAREANDLKLAELQDKRQKNLDDIEQAKRDKAESYYSSMDTMSRTIDTANKVLKSPGFTGYFGTNFNPLSSRYLPGTDAADTSALVDTLKSQGFMSGIQQMRGMGALSNAEGQKVVDAIGNLSPSQSEKSAKAAIQTIINTTQMAQKRMQQKYGKDIPDQERQSPTSQQQLSDDDLINKYLGGR